MEKLVINIPDAKSSIVKQVLHSLGVDISGHDVPAKGNYKKKLLIVSTWSEEDTNVIDNSSKSFNDLKAEEW